MANGCAFRMQRLGKQMYGGKSESERERTSKIVKRKWNEEKSTKPITVFYENSKCTSVSTYNTTHCTRRTWHWQKERERGVNEQRERVSMSKKPNSKRKPKRTIIVLLIIALIDFALSRSWSLALSFDTFFLSSALLPQSLRCVVVLFFLFFLKSLLLFAAQLFYRQLPFLCHWHSNCDCGLWEQQ